MVSGFSWRSGADRDTTGILMWSEPILIEQNGQQIAVLLMDTQGAFDDEHTVKDSATVFALSTMLSSIQVYNILHNLQEDNLQVLQIFTEYGRLALEGSNEAPFQKLLFLIRDWSFPFEFDFGLSGGRKFLEKKLTVKDSHPPQLQLVRKHIRSCFKEIECFLLPYPGKKVATSQAFDGRLDGIEDDFIEHLSAFVPLMLNPEFIQVKEIAGQRVTGIQLMEYFKTYLDIFKGEDMPEPKSMLEATAEANNLAAVASARDLYTKEMEDVCGGSKPYVNPRYLDDKHKEVLERALSCFHGIPKMGGASFSDPFIKCLTEQLLEMFEQFKAINKSKNMFTMLGSPVVFFFWFAFCLIVSKIFDMIGMTSLSSLFLLFGTFSFGLIVVYMTFKYQGHYPEFVSGLDSVAEVIWSHAMDFALKFAQNQVSNSLNSQTSQSRNPSSVTAAKKK
jgi:atlastin